MVDTPAKSPFDDLPDGEFFSRDPEEWDKESLEEAKKRIAKTVERLRRARQP